MGKALTKQKVARNVVLSVAVQAISIIIGFVLNLIVPKFISEYDYAYWQTFLLYSGYLGVFHFGFLNGFVLRYAQYDYDELNLRSIRSQYLTIMLIDFVISIGLFIAAFVLFTGPNRAVCILLSFTTCIEITFSFLSFSFQTTNRIRQYAMYTVVYRALYCILVLACIGMGLLEFWWFCIVYLLADLVVIVYFGLKYSRGFFIGPFLPSDELKQELKETLSAGVWLMISAYAANFLIGSGKMVIQWFWDAYVFGKISLAFSLCSFVLQFVHAVSIILFPSMKRMKQEQLPKMYMQIRECLSPLLLCSLLCFFPGSVILEMWLPKYAQSIGYLGVLMPIIIYTSKTSLLTNNYLKAYRKEKQLLVINVSVVIVSFLLFFLVGSVIKDIYLLLAAVVMMLMIRSIISEIAVMRLIGRTFYFDLVLEFVMTIAFIAATTQLGRWEACLAYVAALMVYCILKRKALASLYRQVVRALKGKKRKPAPAQEAHD